MVGLMILAGIACVCFGGYGMYVPFMNGAGGASASEIDFILSMYETAKYWGEEFSAAEEVAMFALEYRWTFLIVGVVLIVGAIVVKKLKEQFSVYSYYMSKAVEEKRASEGSVMLQKEDTRKRVSAPDFWVCNKCNSRIPNKLTVCKYCGQNRYEE